MELRFPDWGFDRRDDWDLFLHSVHSDDAFAGRNFASLNVTLLKLNRSTADSAPMSDAALRSNWRGPFYASFEIELVPSSRKITIDNAVLRLFGDSFARSQATVAVLAGILGETSTTSFVRR